MFYDEELIVKDVETLFKNKLNAEIDCINTEKGSVAGDPLFIANIPTDKYIFDTINKSLLNYTGYFIRYGIADTPVRDANRTSLIEDLTIYVEVATFDNGTANLNNTMYKLLRYRRALKQVIMKNPEVFRGYAKPLVTGLRPTAFPYSSKYTILAIGVDIQASFSAQ